MPKEWYNHFAKMDNPPPNIEYAAFNLCEIPFIDNSIDVISGSAAIIQTEKLMRFPIMFIPVYLRQEQLAYVKKMEVKCGESKVRSTVY